MDARSGRYVFGCDLESFAAPGAQVEGVQHGFLERARNPANGFRPLPPPTGAYPFHLNLRDLLDAGAIQDIEAAGKLVFHVIGDTGQKSHGAAAQEAVAEHISQGARHSLGNGRASFAYHLGDVVYFNGERGAYEPQFYEPYKNHPAPIFAVPRNHDGAVPAGDASLQGFMENFCAAQPVHSPLAGESPRTTMRQPNCYGNAVRRGREVRQVRAGRGPLESYERARRREEVAVEEQPSPIT